MYNFGNPTPAGSINWVQGLDGAKAVPLGPNGSVVLMDAVNDGIFYIKSSDNIGMCTLRKFRYEEIIDKPAAEPDPEYITRSELEAILKEALKKNEPAVQSNDPVKAKTKPQLREGAADNQG